MEQPQKGRGRREPLLKAEIAAGPATTLELDQ